MFVSRVLARGDGETVQICADQKRWQGRAVSSESAPPPPENKEEEEALTMRTLKWRMGGECGNAFSVG